MGGIVLHKKSVAHFVSLIPRRVVLQADLSHSSWYEYDGIGRRMDSVQLSTVMSRNVNDSTLFYAVYFLFIE